MLTVLKHKTSNVEGVVKSGLLREYEDVVHATQRLADLFLLAGAHVFMTWEYGQIWRRQSSSATAMAVLAFSFAAELCSLYRPWRVERLRVEIRTVFIAWCMTVATLVLLAFATKTSEDYSRVVSFGWFAVSLVVLCGWRFLVRFVLRATRASGKNIRRVAILGATAAARDLCEQIEERPWMGIRVQGVYDDRASDRREDLLDAGCPFLGKTSELVRACRDGRVDIVYVALPLRAELRIMRAMEAAQTVEGKDWHGMKPPVYRSGPDPLRRLARPACGISGSRPTAGERPQA